MELKPLSIDSIPMALERAMRYRLLNEPWQAESICHDILQADPKNQEAIQTLILAVSDQFGTKFTTSLKKAEEIVMQLEDPYGRAYGMGLIFERQATAALKRSVPRSRYIAYNHLVVAMEWYDKAEKTRRPGNDESILRWNTCARLMENYNLEPAPEDDHMPQLLDV